MAMLTMLAICVLLVFDIIWYYLSVYIYTHRYIATLKKIETWNPTKVLVNYVSILFWVAILTYTVYLCLVVTQFSLYGLHTELAMWLEKHRIASRYCEDQRQLLEHQHVAWTFHSFKSIGLSLDHFHRSGHSRRVNPPLTQPRKDSDESSSDFPSLELLAGLQRAWNSAVLVSSI